MLSRCQFFECEIEKKKKRKEKKKKKRKKKSFSIISGVAKRINFRLTTSLLPMIEKRHVGMWSVVRFGIYSKAVLHANNYHVLFQAVQ